MIEIDQYFKIKNFNNRWYRKLAMSIIGPLHKISLGWKYSKTLCKLNLYTRYTEGRCHYCGKHHFE